MIEIKRISTQDETEYAYVEQLMETAFPPEERRDTFQQREYSDHHPLFCSNILQENGKAIGMISYWKMDGFFYIEHLAIDPTLRNGGYGSRVLGTVKQLLQAPIVLEVEMPEEEMSKRRIGFYQRAGFALHEKPYVQPPYRKGDNGLPMYLMTYGDIDMESRFESVRDTIHKEVYGVNK